RPPGADRRARPGRGAHRGRGVPPSRPGSPGDSSPPSTGCREREDRLMPRYCFINRVRPDRLAEYAAAHAAVWPEMLEALRDAGSRRYRLCLSPDALLVGHFEAADYDAAQAAMARTQVNARWQASMEQVFVDPGNPDEGFEVLPEIFSLEDQLQAGGLPTTPST